MPKGCDETDHNQKCHHKRPVPAFLIRNHLITVAISSTPEESFILFICQTFIIKILLVSIMMEYKFEYLFFTSEV